MLFQKGAIMHRVFAIAIVVLSATVFAVTGNDVAYVGGSLSGVKPGDIGAFDTSPVKELVFIEPYGRFPIEYARVLKVEYRKEVAHHLGVAPAIAVGLLKRRERKHFFTL